MAKRYRPVLRDQPFLLPVDMREWLPADHLVWFVVDVVGQLETSVFHRRERRVKAPSGRAAFAPDMLLALLLYGYCQGVRSSRQIERLCQVDVAFRIICAADVPDHSVIARFRQTHQDAFADLFTQVLRLAVKAGLGRFGTIAIDGTKIAANASADANRTEAWLRRQVQTILTEAEQTDAAEDAQFGQRRGEEPPADFGDPAARVARIQAALAEIDAENQAAAGAEATARARDEAQLADMRLGRRHPGRQSAELEVHRARLRRDQLIKAQQARLQAHAARTAAARTAGARGAPGRPPTPIEQHGEIARATAALAAAEARAAQFASRQAQRVAAAAPARANLTDPASRLMPTRRGWLQGYNVQIAASADQLIVATRVGQSPNDQREFLPMLTAAQTAAGDCAAATGRTDLAIGLVLADAGYASEHNLTAAGPDRLIALGKASQLHTDAHRRPAQGPPPPDASPRQAMDHRLRTTEGAQAYKQRGATVEPAIGNLKKIITRFSRRGLQAAIAEIDLAATAFNLLKIYRIGPALA